MKTTATTEVVEGTAMVTVPVPASMLICFYALLGLAGVNAISSAVASRRLNGNGK